MGESGSGGTSGDGCKIRIGWERRDRSKVRISWKYGVSYKVRIRWMRSTRHRCVVRYSNCRGVRGLGAISKACEIRSKRGI
ncbi:hypothetical protein D3C73_461490 [compost metagenome]